MEQDPYNDQRPATKPGLVFQAKTLHTLLLQSLSAVKRSHGEDSREYRELVALCNAVPPIQYSSQSGAFPDEMPPKLVEDATRVLLTIDESWQNLVISDVMRFGENGPDAVGSVSEALLVANALARRWETDPLQIYYRGEEKYGWRLTSRAHRAIGEFPGGGGISDREVAELRRFQSEVLKDKQLSAEIFGSAIPDEDHFTWLAAMQHYDRPFGTRMIDLTSSIFTGLYFACVDWSGNIDSDVDGRLSIFLGARSWRTFAASEDWERLENFDREIVDERPDEVSDAYKGLEYPSIPRLVRDAGTNSRLMAQDGFFLLPVSEEPSWGQHFEIRIPGHVKRKIARELWHAGYTPDRIVRGATGRESTVKLRKDLRT